MGLNGRCASKCKHQGEGGFFHDQFLSIEKNVDTLISLG
jgi:hypothetical protein